MPSSGNVTASTVQWRAENAAPLEQVGQSAGTALPWLFWVLGALITIGVIVAVCVVWRSRKKKKKSKRSAPTNGKEEKGDHCASGDEMQPLVGKTPGYTSGSPAPSFASCGLRILVMVGELGETVRFRNEDDEE